MPPLPTQPSARVQKLQSPGGGNAAIIAYDDILRAEHQAQITQNQGNPILARIVGFLMLELHAHRQVLGNRPFCRLVEEVRLPPREEITKQAQIFRIGREYKDHLIRSCMFNPLYVSHSKSQLFQSWWDSQQWTISRTHPTSFMPLLRYDEIVDLEPHTALHRKSCHC